MKDRLRAAWRIITARKFMIITGEDDVKDLYVLANGVNSKALNRALLEMQYIEFNARKK